MNQAAQRAKDAKQDESMLAGPPGSTAAIYETGHKAQVEAEGLESWTAVNWAPTEADLCTEPADTELRADEAGKAKAAAAEATPEPPAESQAPLREKAPWTPVH